MADRCDRRKAKKLRQKLARGRGTADEALAIYGDGALAEVTLMTPSSSGTAGPSSSVGKETALHLADVQNVLLWALTADRGEMPRWICVSRKPLLRGALLVLLPNGFDVRTLAAVAHLTVPQAVKLPRAHHSRLVSATASELLQVKLPRKRKAQTAAVAAATEARDGQGPHVGRDDATGGWRMAYVRSFCASADELRENGFPVVTDGETKVHGVAAERAASYLPLTSVSYGEEVTVVARLLAIDCEMVLVRGDHRVDGGWPLVKQLASVAVVDEAGAILMNELVRPERPVVDYLTQYSGVTASILSTASLTFDEARAKVCEIIGGKGAVLIGHSLECDLHALRLAVPANACILDTSLLFPLRCHRNGPPTKCALRNLSVQHLRREIQQASAAGEGHSPTEDACAAMDLALIKLRRGHEYGVPEATCGGVEPLYDVLHRANWSCHAVDTSEALEGTPHASVEAVVTTLADGWQADPCRPSAMTLVPCPDDTSATRAAERALRSDDKPFVWLGLHEHPCGGTAPSAGQCEAIGTGSSERDEVPRDAAEDAATAGAELPNRDTGQLLRGLLAAVPPNTLVCMIGVDGAFGRAESSCSACEQHGHEPKHGPAPAAADGDGDQKRRARRPPPAPGWVTLAVTAGLARDAADES